MSEKSFAEEYGGTAELKEILLVEGKFRGKLLTKNGKLEVPIEFTINFEKELGTGLPLFNLPQLMKKLGKTSF